MKKKVYTVAFSALLFSRAVVPAQTEIATIPFETIPEGSVFVGSTGTIELQSDTVVTGTLGVTGTVSSDSGFEFPDGTVQVTAALANASLTANQGLYNNTIVDFSPPNAYSEICIKGGAVFFDIHATGESTSGGNCIPGDTGWVIERFERDGGAVSFWTAARMECLKDGMRLPEPFEWQLTCESSGLAATSAMTDNFEWSSNTVGHVFNGNEVFLVVPTLGGGSCRHGTANSITFSNGTPAERVYRCAR